MFLEHESLSSEEASEDHRDWRPSHGYVTGVLLVALGQKHIKSSHEVIPEVGTPWETMLRAQLFMDPDRGPTSATAAL